MPVPAGLSSEDCARFFAPLTDFDHLLVAVSGGVDSTVLLRCLHQWAKQQDAERMQAGRSALLLSVACVDHGLRAGSALEAQAVVTLAHELGCAGAVLPWTGEKPLTGLQEKARARRYDLLRDHAGKIGAEAVVLAHHADDQAETVLMRMAAGSGPDGLCGMQRRSERGALFLLRPFLSVPKAVLLATAQAHRWAWHEDPSNQQTRFERVRLRQLQALREASGLTAARLGRLAGRLARQQEAIEHMVAEYWARLAQEMPERIVLAEAIWSCPAEIRLRLLHKALRFLKPEQEVRLERLEGLQEILQDWACRGAHGRRNLGGCVVSLSGAGRLTIAPEPARRGKVAS